MRKPKAVLTLDNADVGLFPRPQDLVTTEALSSIATLFATGILRSATRRSTGPAQPEPVFPTVDSPAPESADVSVMETAFLKGGRPWTRQS
jgi:hypothetical protein